ncbi:MAG: phosphate signaling complex protein PhoU [Synergistaceae bacterium]|nr:phosphate signaling complex protein PhoU [Synergistaceae bacterium]
MTLLNKEKKSKEQELEAYLYASDKARLVEMVTEMGERASSALKEALSALKKQDVTLAQRVIEGDDVIDELEEQIDQECLYSIAMRQPMREDLRFVYAVMKIITDIERIGDQAVNISLRLVKLTPADRRDFPMLDDIDEMAEHNMTMLKEALDAFIREDASIIASTRAHRKKVHQIRDGAVEKLMKNSSPTTPQDITTGKLFASMWILRHLSRISDHVLNLAEKVAFIATGVSPLTMKKMGQKEAAESRAKQLGDI